jgi:TRAP-type transport system periplasmic protein
MRKSSYVVVLAALMLGLVPGSAWTAPEQLVLKVAVQIPRSQEAAIETKRYNEELAALTDNKVQVRVYWGGAAGDDVDILRKMRAGQIDGAPLSLELVSRFVRQALVLSSPRLFTNYRQVDAARAELTPSMNEEAYANGFKMMAWGDVGRLRLLSARPVETLGDFRKMRPWLYAQSETLKEFYKTIGATGVPLGIGEVYGGLQTGMIDVVWSSALLAAALNWHAGTTCISDRGFGFIQIGFAFRRGAWDALPKGVQDSMTKLSHDRAQKNQIEARKTDERTFQRLLQRGHKPIKLKNEAEWVDAGRALRKRMIGRVYTQELVSVAEKIAARYPDPPAGSAATAR